MPVRFAVAGLGAMGRHHVRVLSEMPEAELVAVADPDQESREQIRRERPATTYSSVEEMLTEADFEALVVAVPTSHHKTTTIMALEAGKHALVEKPLAVSAIDAVDILAARGPSQIVTVGHIERYNPAVLKLRELLESDLLGRIFQVRALRTGPLPIRIQDVGVVIDLATHDLDMMNYLVPGSVESVFGLTAQRVHALQEDLAAALLTFDSGVIGFLDTNWLTPVKIRELVVVGRGGMFRLDFINQDVFFYENATNPYWNGRNGRSGVSEGNMTRYQIDRREPLRNELETFAGVIRGERPETDLVSVQDGAIAVSLAEAVLESARSGLAVKPSYSNVTASSEVART